MAHSNPGRAGAAMPPSLAGRVQSEVERTIQRSLRGLELLGSPAPAVGLTPKAVLHRRGTLNLYHYHAQSDEVYRVPLLIVMAPSNKAFILDLTPGQSLVEFLLKRGYDVYVMDWSAPSDAERGLGIDDYVLDFIPECVRQVQQRSGVEDVTVVGYCAGGMLATIYAALNVDGPLKNLVCFTTPIDFTKMELFRRMTEPGQFDVDQMVDTLGNVPAQMVINSFDLLRPASRVVSQLRLWDNLWNDEYVKSFRMMERWGNETLPLPGAYFRQFVNDLLRNNKLYESGLEIRGRRVDIGRIRVPLLSIVAQHDHIVPPQASRPLIERVGSTDKEEVMLPGGHVSIAAGANAVKRMWPQLDQWLSRRST